MDRQEMHIMKPKVEKRGARLEAWLFVAIAGTAALVLLAACVDSAAKRAEPADASVSGGTSNGGATFAPEFPVGLPWLDTAEPLTMKELRGKIVLIDFWTYGCINCIHDIPWLKKMQADFPNYLVVIGVNSAKFSEEGNTKNIREIILRYGITWPVINDYRFKVWNEWGVDVWPTLALVDPTGKVVGFHTGEGFYPVFKPIIASLVQESGKKGLLDPRPIKLKLESQGLPESVLAFPGKVRVDPKGNRLFIADTGHNRIVIAALDSGQVLEVIGKGRKGFSNGDFRQAEFDKPEGMALSPDGKTLYVADTANHAIRAVDLTTRKVTTLAGGKAGWRDGKDARFYEPGGLDAANGKLYIADTNNNAIRVVNIATGVTSTLILQGISLLSKGDLYANKVVTLAAAHLATGRGEVRLSVHFPEGYAANAQAPSEVEVQSTGAVSLQVAAHFNEADPHFPMSFPATFTAGTGEVTVDLSIVYCQDRQASVCLIKQVRLVVPVTVSAATTSGGEAPILRVDYLIRLSS